MSQGDWLGANTTSNILKQSYVGGFVDISGGDLIVRNGNFSVGGFIAQNTDVSSLAISGTNYAYSTVTQFSDTITATINNALNAAGVVSATYPYFTADAYFDSRLFVAGDASLNGQLFINNTITGNSHLYLAGDASLNGDLFVGGILNATGGITSPAFLNATPTALPSFGAANANLTNRIRGQTIDPIFLTATATPVTGNSYFYPVYLNSGTPITNFLISVAAAFTPTSSYMGLYNNVGTQLAITANKASAYTIGVNVLPITTPTPPYPTTYSGVYYIAFNVNGGTLTDVLYSSVAIPANVNTTIHYPTTAETAATLGVIGNARFATATGATLPTLSTAAITIANTFYPWFACN